MGMQTIRMTPCLFVLSTCVRTIAVSYFGGSPKAFFAMFSSVFSG
jgi:hypothetical protein